jgi:hypothetical protein
MPRVFVSYVTDDLKRVTELAEVLRELEITVWLDKNDLTPGLRWKDAIRQSISSGDFFLACFSKAYMRRQKSYMNEELTLAIEELRLRPSDRVWFIPARLSPCEIPDRSIGAGETLRSLQWVDLWKADGIQRLLAVLQPGSEVVEKLIRGLQSDSRRERFRSADAIDRLGPIAGKALPYLLQLANKESSEADYDTLSMVSVASAIGKMGVWTADVHATLRRMMLNGGYAGDAAGCALARFGDEVIPTILEGFTANISTLIPLNALAAVGTAAAAKAILDNFENKRGDLQYMSEEVAELLGELGANAIQAIPLLERMLSEDANLQFAQKLR